MSDTRKMVFFSLLVALGTTLHVVEGMIPNPFPIPGVKLGLANVVTFVAVYLYGLRSGLAVGVLRVILGSLVGGVFLSPAFLLSLSGSVVSTLIMAFLLRFAPCFSIRGVSVAGAVSHNAGQLLTAALIMRSCSIFFYLAFLLPAALVTGMITGHLMDMVLGRLERSGVVQIYAGGKGGSDNGEYVCRGYIRRAL
jgi:heptaprenyl diphosphate synthase